MVTMAHQQTPQRAAGRPSIGGRTSFPILHPSEIIQALAGLNIEISKDELVEPHRNREKLRNIFLQLVSQTNERDRYMNERTPLLSHQHRISHTSRFSFSIFHSSTCALGNPKKT